MQFSKLYESNSPTFSLEFFPPKDPEHLEKTLTLVRRLSELKPDYMTVTYGAGGSTRGLTKEITSFIVRELDIPAVAHLTCVNHSVSELDNILDELRDGGIKNILALRGDPPKGEGKFTAHPEGFSCARDLAKHIRGRGDFSVAVAGYPEVHPDAESPEKELQYLREKQEAGGEVIITQLFFDSELFFGYVERCREAGITAPIVPGVLPFSSLSQLERIVAMCGATLPVDIVQQLEAFGDNKEAARDFGTQYTLALCKRLLEGGAPGIHFYTLNRSKQVEMILGDLHEAGATQGASRSFQGKASAIS